MNFDFSKPTSVEVVLNNNEIKIATLNTNKAILDDICIDFDENNTKFNVYLTAQKSLISHIFLKYKISFNHNSYVFGDAIERGYGDLIWTKYNPARQMFWYFFIKDNHKKTLDCFGVDVLPNSIVSYFLKDDELVIDINTQSGGSGVNLEGRKILLGSFNFRSYQYENLDSAIKDFLQVLMGEVKIKKAPRRIYGFNNWYYAYGESSYKQIIKDTLLLEELTKDNEVIPYMVIDDGWSINSCGGPWVANDKFKDMELLAKEIKSHRAIPGIWFRPLKDEINVTKEVAHPLVDFLFDPTLDSTINLIKESVARFVNWGYELIKFDFITVDLFWKYGFQMDNNLTEQGWKFANNHSTNAEIIKNMYFAIREAAKDAVLIGCNAIGHLCAGICELNRTGDDTSGFEWERTRKYGVNSLAYRLYHNDVFYKIDADCVGIMNKIDWEQNKLWLDILSRSSSPLFVSVDPDLVNEEIKKDLKEAFKLNSSGDHSLIPLDIDDNLLPREWKFDNKIITYDWFIVK